MGFLRRKKHNDYDDEQQSKNIAAEAESEAGIPDEDEEDDFSPIIKKPKKPTPEEFRAAALENFKAAAEENHEKTEDNTTDFASENAEDEENESEISDAVPDADENDNAEYISESDSDINENADEADNDTDDDCEDDTDDFGAAEPEETDTSEPAKPKEKKHRFRNFRKNHKTVFTGICIGIGTLFGAALAIYIYCCITAPKGVMGRNIYIENVNVSNLTYEQALEKVKNEPFLISQNITVTCDSQTYTINGADAGLTAELAATVDKAMRYGKTKNIFINGLANWLQIFARHTVVPNANVNEAAVREKLDEFGKQIHGELVEHNLELGDGVTICTPGHSGFDGNTDKAWEQVIYAITHEKFNHINVSLSKGEPAVLTVQDVDNFTWLETKDASFEMVDNQINVVAEQNGRFIDKEQTAKLIADLHEGGEIIEIPFTTIPAAVTADDLQAKLFNATLGSYATSYGTSTANRCANIANAAGRINGKILMPGDVFSFNDTVGPRSVANGFHTAKEYVDGQTVDGIGGGTCQVSSTLYNAVIYSNLSIVSRTNHMFPVGYCPLGQDATVADSGIDFKFVNNTDYPIKISAVTGGYRVTISIIGTQRDDPLTVKVTNTTNKVGNDTRVRTTRNVYNSAGELVSSDQLPGSYYMAHPE